MPSVEDDIALVRNLLGWAGLNPSRAARRIGVANTTLNRFANGTARSRIGRDTLEKLRTAFPDFPDFLPGAAEPPPPPLPVYATRLESVRIDDIDVEQTVLSAQPTDHIVGTGLSQRYPGAYAMHITGSSMHPALREGEFVVAAPSGTFQIGDHVAVSLATRSVDEQPMLIKELTRRTATQTELREYDPPRLLSIPTDRVLRLDRILSRFDMLPKR